MKLYVIFYIYMNKVFHLCIHFVVLSAIEVILDELRKNDVDNDMIVLSCHIHHCLEQYKIMFE